MTTDTLYLPFEVTDPRPAIAPPPTQSPEQILAKVRALHRKWGNTEGEINTQRLWEQFDEILGGAL